MKNLEGRVITTYRKNFSYSFSIILVVFLCIQNSVADPYIVISGEVSNTVVKEGDRIRFTGSIFRNRSEEQGELMFMNVTLAIFERTIISANIFRSYEGERQVIRANTTYTDTIDAKMDYNPGRYNASILFMIKDSNHSTPDFIVSYYVLTNISLIIQGTTQIQEGLLVISVIFAGLVGVFIAVVVKQKLKARKFR